LTGQRSRDRKSCIVCALSRAGKPPVRKAPPACGAFAFLDQAAMVVIRAGG
jgi:hypothetical protein